MKDLCFIQLRRNLQKYLNLICRREDYELLPRFAHHCRLSLQTIDFAVVANNCYSLSVATSRALFRTLREPSVVSMVVLGELKRPVNSYLTLTND